MTIDYCPQCRAMLILPDKHRHICPPMWEARCPEWDEDWKPSYAWDAAEAAENHCQRIDDKDYECAVEERVVEIRKPDSDEVFTYNVEMEYERKYYASEKLRE